MGRVDEDGFLDMNSLDVTESGLYQLVVKVGPTKCFGRSDLTLLDSKHRVLSMPSAGCSRLKQQGATCVGLVFGPAFVCRSCSCNAVRALVARHGVKQPKVFANLPLLESFAFRLRASYAGNWRHFDSWFDKWPLSKRLAISRSLLEEACRPDRVKSFVKREVNHDDPSRPRLIQGYANLATQERFGREFTVFQKSLVEVCQFYEVYPGITITMASGLNSLQIAEWMSVSMASCRSRPVFLECDGSNWDATMSLMHHLTKLFYLEVCSPELADFVDDCFRVIGSVSTRSGLFRYRLVGTVKSGHNDTTSGNSLINMLICAESLHVLGKRGHIIVAGDDSLIVVDGHIDVGCYVDTVTRFGIVPKARVFLEVRDVTFISGCWIRQPFGYLFVPQLGRLLARLWWTVQPPSNSNFENYRHSVVCGLRPLVGSLPIYREFLAIHDFQDASIVSCDKLKHSPHVLEQLQSVDVDFHHALEDMAAKYSLPRTALVSFAEWLVHCDPSPAFAVHPVASVIMHRDLLSLCERPSTADS